MWDSIRQITVSEVILLFVLVFLIPITFVILRRLRQYEKRFGLLSGQPVPMPQPKVEKTAPAPAAGEPDVPADSFPYKSREFLSQPEKACLDALREALGDEVEIYPKVSVASCVVPTDPNPGYARRLGGLFYDFLVCDKALGQPLTAIMFKGKKGGAGDADTLRKICQAAGANLVFIQMAEQYDAKRLKDELGIPEFDL